MVEMEPEYGVKSVQGPTQIQNVLGSRALGRKPFYLMAQHLNEMKYLTVAPAHCRHWILTRQQLRHTRVDVPLVGLFMREYLVGEETRDALEGVQRSGRGLGVQGVGHLTEPIELRDEPLVLGSQLI